MSDHRNAVDQLVDLLVYAPIGLLYERDDVLPRLVTRGRSQVRLARVLGQLALRRGQGQLEERLTDALGAPGAGVAKVVTDLGTLIGLAPPPGDDPWSTAGTTTGAGDGEAAGNAGTATVEAAPPLDAPARTSVGTAAEAPPAVPQGDAERAAPAVDEPEPAAAAGVGTAGEEPPATAPPDQGAPRAALPIAGYDQLRAREIIPLLADLSPSQRRVVRDHELGNRHRKTVLHQLELLGA